MKPRSSHVRSKIVALLASLIALWAFAAVITLRESLSVLWIGTLDQRVGRPTDGLITALQEERRVTVIYLNSGHDASRRALDDARLSTDQAKATLLESIRDRRAEWAAGAATERRLDDLVATLPSVAPMRSTIDSRGILGDRAARTFTDVVAAALRVHGALAAQADGQLGGESAAGVTLRYARELLSQEDVLMTGALAAGTITPADRVGFVQLVGASRTRLAEVLPALPAGHRPALERTVTGPAMSRLHDAEDRVLNQSTDGGLPLSAQTWRASADPAMAELGDTQRALVDAVAARVQPGAAWAIVRLALAGGLGLLAVIACVIVSVTTARALVRSLEQLRDAALELAYERLPRVVERLQKGEQVDLAVEVRPINSGTDEIGQVGQAFNTVQQTAVRIAVEQAELRRGVRDLFLDLARRSQSLLHRQLGLLDTMERQATDADDLAALFQVDHLATRLRRNAENLIVLSGAVPGRAWRQPVAMIDVVRGALAEVEDYTRVNLLPIEAASLVGRAVGDVIHLLAELIENAVTFSPPQTTVRVSGSFVANGFVVEIEDRGLGMEEADRAIANEHLRFSPGFRPTSTTARLGLYVVGRLADRHGIRVELSESVYGGTTAVVLLPADIVAQLAEPTPGGDEIPFRAGAVARAEPDHTVDAYPRPGLTRTDGLGRRIGVDTAAHLTLPPLPSIGSDVPTSSGPPPTRPVPPRADEPGIAPLSDVPPPVGKLRLPSRTAGLGDAVWAPPPARPSPDLNRTGHNGVASRKATRGRNGAAPTNGVPTRVVSSAPPELRDAPPAVDRSMTTEQISYTPGGLPIRHRSDGAASVDPTVEVDPLIGHSGPALGGFVSSLAANGGRHGVPEPDLPEARSGAAVEAMRQRLTAYQRGTRRGRAASGEQLVVRTSEPGEESSPSG
jgi:signal transduction histidine kinase